MRVVGIKNPLTPFLSLSLPVFSFPSRKNRRGCFPVALSTCDLFFGSAPLPKSSSLGLGNHHGLLSSCTEIGREWRPYPPVPSGVFDSSFLLCSFYSRGLELALFLVQELWAAWFLCMRVQGIKCSTRSRHPCPQHMSSSSEEPGGALAF